MLKTVRALAIVIAVFLALPLAGYAADDFAKKYGIELTLGGSYYNLADVNDFLADQDFAAYTPDRIHMGTQLGVTLLYRSKPNFGWQIGYNKLFSGVPGSEQMFKHEAVLVSKGAALTSSAEQRVSGSETFALAMLYTHAGPLELSVGAGPAIYSANLERTVVLYQSAGLNAPANPSGFSDATGWTTGLIGKVGLELDFTPYTGIALELGGRLAKVTKVKYTSPNTPDQETIVMTNSYSNSSLPVDFSGGFARLSVRMYFSPASGWRDPRKD